MHVPALVAALVMIAGAEALAADPGRTVDLATLSPATDAILRVHGSVGNGELGTPVAGGRDVDGDGFVDVAFASMLADALGRSGAGVVYLVFGDGTIGGTLDTGVADTRILQIIGAGPLEAAGSELWIDDVTGDGLGDLLVARQNHRPDAGRPGAGALTVLVGGAALRAAATAGTPIDLASVPTSVTAFTLVGANAIDRLGMWMRTGDVDGDGTADLVVSADQEDGPGAADRGAVYLVRGGPHLATTATVDLAGFGATALAGNLAKILPPAGATEYHFGATCQIADLDGNGLAEVLAASALNRAGGILEADGASAGSAHGAAGVQDGTVWIVWDDNLPAPPWPAGYTVTVDAPPGTITAINGGADNVSFGEEMLGGLDWDADGTADLFVGDIVGDLSGSRIASGSGHVLYDAATLKGAVFDMDAPPPGLVTTTFLGGAFADIAGDTAMQGDFDGDGIPDLAFSSPHADPLGRTNAGAIHVLFGQSGPWPAMIDLATGALPDPSLVRIAVLFGAHGEGPGDAGDTLCYSGAAGDVDGDGRDDVITNEMVGNGVLASAIDVGNLIVVSGRELSGPRVTCPAVPRPGCRQPGTAKVKLMRGADASRDKLVWVWKRGEATSVGEFGAPLGSDDAYGVCLYDGGAPAQPVLAASVGGGAEWRTTRNGYAFGTIPGPGLPLQRITLRAGATGRAGIVVKGRGDGLGAPTLPLAFPLKMQFVAEVPGSETCWEATFAAPRRNDASVLVARTP